MPPVNDALITELDVVTLYNILRLRADVFVVEQQCPYPELDGRDLEPTARHLWIAEGDTITSTLRLLREPDGTYRIGRVATRSAARGAGLAAQLVARALELVGAADVVLDAQLNLEDWYVRFGFVRTGEPFDDDGILHVPMRRLGSQR